MKHEQSDILKAYADNTDLVIILNDDGKWIHTSHRALFDYSEMEFFACLPQHKDACLHWLSGGDCQIVYPELPDVRATPKDEFGSWVAGTVWMKSKEIRIKPKKEKRWIFYDQLGNFKGEYKLKPESMAANWQLIEIEIEV